MSTRAAAAALQATFHQRIPISAAMGVQVSGWDGQVLTLEAPLAPNVNVHDTGFAGSLYSVAALCGWGYVHLCLAAAEEQADIVIARASIQYHRPVTGALQARCAAADGVVAEALARLRRDGRSRFPLTVTLGDPEHPEAVLEGGYSVVRRPAAC